MMDIFEQMIYHVRSIQYLDFLQKLKNNKLKYVPHFKKESDKVYKFVHPYKKMIKQSEIEDFELRNVEIMYRVTRNFIWSFDRLTMDYREDVVTDKVERIIARKLQVDVYDSHEIKYGNHNELQTLLQFNSKLKEAEETLRKMEKEPISIRYAYFKTRIDELDAFIADVATVTEKHFASSLRDMRRAKRSFRAACDSIIKKYSKQKAIAEKEQFDQHLNTLQSMTDVQAIEYLQQIQPYYNDVEVTYLDQDLTTLYQYISENIKYLLKIYKLFKADMAEVNGLRGMEKIMKIEKIVERYGDNVLNKEDEPIAKKRLFQIRVNELMTIKNNTEV